MYHRGEIVEKIVRRSGHSITKLATMLGISRSTLYNSFDDPNLNYQFIIRIGDIIGYNFIIEFPEMKEELKLTDERIISFQQGENRAAALWRIESKHAHILEKYEKLLKLAIEVANANELHHLQQEITQLMALEKTQEKLKGRGKAK